MYEFIKCYLLYLALIICFPFLPVVMLIYMVSGNPPIDAWRDYKEFWQDNKDGLI